MVSDITKTPREELECKKKYLYEHSMFWECNDGSKCQILEDDVCELLNEQQATISSLQTELELTANTKLFSRKELERKVKEQQAEIERLQKIIDLTNYQLKVQDRIIQEIEEKE